MRALLSVTDKTGLSEFAGALQSQGWTLLASGGTASHLRSAGLSVEDVSAVTHSPEVLGGRVKTLHPAVHAGILSRRSPEDEAELAAQGWSAIDMVVVNLYAFEETIARDPSLAEAVEQIDIGGVALLRAAAKNFEHVWVVSESADYARVLDGLRANDPTLRRYLAGKAFTHTARYDEAISGYLAASPLRYGENPHQAARLHSLDGPLGGRLLGGKELSYNNLLDLDAAWRAVEGFSAPTVAVIKHLSPCGLASAPKAAEALKEALECDPVSAFGGIVACNRDLDAPFVEALGDLFLECVAAPGFSREALEALRPRKNLRLLEMLAQPPEKGEWRTVRGGRIWQERDHGHLRRDDWKIVTEREPDTHELESLIFAWQACQHVRSNAIVLALGTATVGIGGGQPNRVDSLRIALNRAKKPARVLASDAFFPFADSLELAAEAGIRAVIQPGGSVRDQDSIDCANRHHMAMIFTGRRHFRH